MIGTWMAYALAVSGIAMAAGLGLERALERLGRPTRWVWICAMLVGVVVPAWALLRAPLPSGAGAAGLVPGVGDVVLVGAAALPAPPAAPRFPVDEALLAGWGAASLLGLLAIAWSVISLARVRRRWRWAQVEGAGAWISEQTGPAVVGFLRPSIVVPEWVLEWHPSLQRLIVAHEREHIRAGDGRMLLAALLLVCAAPWNVVLWWQMRRLRQAVEMDCDGRVLASEPDVRRYGTLLLEVADRTRRQPLLVAAFAESRSFLERRIRIMTRRRARNRAAWLLALAASVVAAPAALMAVPAPAPVGFRAVRGAVAGLAGTSHPVAPPTVELATDTIPTGQAITYEARQLETKPELLNASGVPALMNRLYPRELKAAGVGGTAVMQFVITLSGTVDSTSIRAISASDPRFGAASEALVKQFRFQPGRSGGKTVRTLIQMPVTWQPAGKQFGYAAGVGSETAAAADTVPGDFSYTVAVLERKPELLNRTDIRILMNRFYPPELRAAGVGGTSIVEFIVQPDGRVDSTSVKVISATPSEFGGLSGHVAESFRFRPGLHQGRPVSALIRMPITWEPDTNATGRDTVASAPATADPTERIEALIPRGDRVERVRDR